MRDGLSASDVALLSGNGNNGNDGFGGDFGAYWIIIFIIFAFWGRGGWGNDNGSNGSNGGGSVMDAYVLNSDFATLQRLIDNGFDRVSNGINQVNNGLCNGFYEVASQFNTTNSNIMQGNFALQTAINGVGTQLQSCCCELGRGQDQINYNLAMNSNAIQNALCNSTRDIVDSQNNGTRAILDAITANRIEDKNAQIQAQQNQITALQLAASQQAQNAYLLNELKPCPIPAYITCNPYQSYSLSALYGNNGCGCGCGTSL